MWPKSGSLIIALAFTAVAHGGDYPYLQSCGEYEAVGRLTCGPSLSSCGLRIFEGSAAEAVLHLKARMTGRGIYRDQNIRLRVQIGSRKTPLQATPVSDEMSLAFPTHTPSDLRLIKKARCVTKGPS